MNASFSTTAWSLTARLGAALIIAILLGSVGCSGTKNPEPIYEEGFEDGRAKGRGGDPLAEEDFEDGEESIDDDGDGDDAEKEGNGVSAGT